MNIGVNSEGDSSSSDYMKFEKLIDDEIAFENQRQDT